MKRIEHKTFPLVSILVPAYNVENIIEGLLSDIVNQTYDNWELIIVDDKSTDNTIGICKSFANNDHKIHIIECERNSGSPMIPRCKASRASRGELLCPLDADDRIDINYISEMVRRMNETSADIVYPDLQLVKDGIRKSIFRKDLLSFSEIYNGRDLVYHTLFEWHLGCNGGLYKRHLYQNCSKKILQMKLSDKSIKTHFDVASYPFIDETLTRLLLAEANQVAFAPKAIYEYTYNSDSVVNAVSLNCYTHLESNYFLREVIKQHFDKDESAWGRMQLSNFCDIVNCMVKFRKERNLLSKKQRDLALEIMQTVYKNIKWKEVRPYITWKYYFTMRLGFLPALYIFSTFK